ncbi:MAG: hypothetical protein ABSG00_08435 [Terracidiphilus sp.]|jgi:hypothetical protein
MCRLGKILRRLIYAVLFASPLTLSLPLHPQTGAPTSSAASRQESSSALLAVVKDWGSLAGTVGGWPTAKAPRVPVEFLVAVTASGEWIDPTRQCSSDNSTDAGGDAPGCKLFLNQYLNRPKTYTIVTSPGRGTTVQVKALPKLGDCYDFASSGLLSAPGIGTTAIAADSPGLFAAAPAWQSVSAAELAIVRKGLLALGAEKVRNFTGVRVRKVAIEGQTIFVAERHSTAHRQLGIVFAVGRIVDGNFDLMRWNENGGEAGDTVEGALGVIRLKNGREFLITTESDPEGQRFYAYEIKDGRLQIVFEGGGSSC